MNKKIEELNKVLSTNKEEEEKIMESLKEEYFKIFEDSGLIKKMRIDLENSEDYSNEEYWPHWPCQYVYCSDYPGILSDNNQVNDFLEEYLNEYYFIRIENDCFTYSQGPSIIIQDNGTVWDQDSDKVFIDKEDYSSEEELFSLIENYMESTGVFPGVFEADYYGCIRYPVNTRKYLNKGENNEK